MPIRNDSLNFSSWSRRERFFEQFELGFVSPSTLDWEEDKMDIMKEGYELISLERFDRINECFLHDLIEAWTEASMILNTGISD